LSLNNCVVVDGQFRIDALVPNVTAATLEKGEDHIPNGGPFLVGKLGKAG
jgi:hypothetical protein